MNHDVFTFNSEASVFDLHEALDLRLRRIKSLAGVRIISSVVDESANSEEYENSYWATIEELAIQAETIQEAIRDKVREKYLMEN